MDIISSIRKIINDTQLRIDIFHDEIIFYLYEVEIPIVYIRDTQKIVFKPSYLNDHYYGNGWSWNIEMFEEIYKVMQFLNSYKSEFKDW